MPKQAPKGDVLAFQDLSIKEEDEAGWEKTEWNDIDWDYVEHLTTQIGNEDRNRQLMDDRVARLRKYSDSLRSGKIAIQAASGKFLTTDRSEQGLQLADGLNVMSVIADEMDELVKVLKPLNISRKPRIAESNQHVPLG